MNNIFAGASQLDVAVDQAKGGFVGCLAKRNVAAPPEGDARGNGRQPNGQLDGKRTDIPLAIG